MFQWGRTDQSIPLEKAKEFAAAHRTRPTISTRRAGFSCDQRGSFNAESARSSPAPARWHFSPSTSAEIEPMQTLPARGSCSGLPAVLRRDPSGIAQAAEQFRIDPNHTFVHFAVVHTGVSSATDDSTYRRHRIARHREAGGNRQCEIDWSLDTGVKQLDGILIGESFFDVGKFRTATFSGRAVRFGIGFQRVQGNLTVKGTAGSAHGGALRLSASHRAVKHYVCGGDLTAT
jgi:polyisoprenoid-binding protein YceI